MATPLSSHVRDKNSIFIAHGEDTGWLISPSLVTMGILCVVSADATLACTLLESSYYHLFTIVQEAPHFLRSITKDYQSSPISKSLRSSLTQSFHRLYIWLVSRILLPFTSSLKSTCFGARCSAMWHTCGMRLANIIGSSLWPLQ